MLEIVERSSGYWIVGDLGVEWDEPFIHLSEALKKLSELNLIQIELRNKDNGNTFINRRNNNE